MNGLQTLPQWKDYFNSPTGAILGAMNAVYPAGKIVALFLVAPLADRIGRKKTIAIGYTYRGYRAKAISYSARFRPRRQQASRHTPSPSKVCATKSRVDQTEALLLSIARPCCASRPVEARQTVLNLPWCRRKTPPLAQETGARARYLPRCSPAKGVLHPMCIM